jgi:hypothetical protein
MTRLHHSAASSSPVSSALRLELCLKDYNETPFLIGCAVAIPRLLANRAQAEELN